MVIETENYLDGGFCSLCNCRPLEAPFYSCHTCYNEYGQQDYEDFCMPCTLKQTEKVLAPEKHGEDDWECEKCGKWNQTDYSNKLSCRCTKCGRKNKIVEYMIDAKKDQ